MWENTEYTTVTLKNINKPLYALFCDDADDIKKKKRNALMSDFNICLFHAKYKYLSIIWL